MLSSLQPLGLWARRVQGPTGLLRAEVAYGEVMSMPGEFARAMKSSDGKTVADIVTSAVNGFWREPSWLPAPGNATFFLLSLVKIEDDDARAVANQRKRMKC